MSKMSPIQPTADKKAEEKRKEVMRRIDGFNAELAALQTKWDVRQLSIIQTTPISQGLPNLFSKIEGAIITVDRAELEASLKK